MFNNGVVGLISASGGLSVKLSLTSGEIVIGADGSWLEVNQKNKHLRTPYFFDRRMLMSQPNGSAMQMALEELCSQITKNVVPTVTLQEVYDAQRLLYSIVLSELNGGIRFPVSDVPMDLVITGKTENRYA